METKAADVGNYHRQELTEGNVVLMLEWTEKFKYSMIWKEVITESVNRINE